MPPILAIVGRANVGKSRLFNRIVGRAKALVHGEPGLTRDRHYSKADWAGKEFVVVDTGGIDLDPRLDLERRVTAQSMRAIAEADAVIAVFDGQAELTALDRELIERLRKLPSPVVYAVNKIDAETHAASMLAFEALGLNPIVAISAEHGRGVDDLLEAVVHAFPPSSDALPTTEGLRVAVMGRPNVGKSTLINRLLGEERVIAHERPGTTRDCVDVEITHKGEQYTFIDTAGIHRHYRVEEGVTRWATLRSLRTIERADIVCQLIDAKEGLTRQDLQLASHIIEEGKGLVLLINKWDLIRTPWEKYREELRNELGDLEDLPLLPISAKSGEGCQKIFRAIADLNRQLTRHIATAALNRFLERATAEHHLPSHRGKLVRINYVTQTKTHPPTFSFFCNTPQAVPFTYRRYLIRRLKEEFELEGAPVKVVMRRK